jgi:hypothetical protein
MTLLGAQPVSGFSAAGSAEFPPDAAAAWRGHLVGGAHHAASKGCISMVETGMRDGNISHAKFQANRRHHSGETAPAGHPTSQERACSSPPICPPT